MRVLFIDRVHPVLRQRLEAAGMHCEEDLDCSREGLSAKMGGYQGLVLRSRLPIDRPLLEQAESLQWIARSGSGLENIDLIAAKEKGIEVFSSPEGNRDALAEHCLGMLLQLLHRLHIAHREVQQGLWRREANRGRELKSLCFGIVGYGHMGSAVAERLRSFGCRILAYDKYKEHYGNAYVEACKLEDLQREADVLSIHLPQSDESRYFVNAELIKSMRKPFYLINTARGAHVDTAALYSGIRAGKVLGACLDVLEYEKRSLEGLSDEGGPGVLRRLLEMEQVIVTPHIAGWTHESYVKLSEVLADKILARFRVD